MKGVIVSMTLLLTSMALLLGFGWWIQFDHVQNMTSLALKNAMEQTMMEMENLDYVESLDVFESIEEKFKRNALPGYSYELSMLGFVKEPFLVNMQVKVENTNALTALKFHVQEVMVEEVR